MQQSEPEVSPIDWEAQSRQSMQALGNVLDRLSPWLFAFGSWIFGGLIGFNLVVLGALLTVGPTHLAILVSMAAFAGALPLNMAGLLLLKLVQEMKDVHIDEEMYRAFKEAGFPIDLYVPPDAQRTSTYKRRTQTALLYSVVILGVAVALTMTGMVSALWYMAWWIGVVFLAMALLSQVLVILVMVHSLPPESATEKQVKERYKKYGATEKEREEKEYYKEYLASRREKEGHTRTE